MPFYPPNSPKSENFKKNEKNSWRYQHFTQVYQKSWQYVTLFLRYGAWLMQNQNFQKRNKAPADIIILYKCTKNYHHMLYCSWDMVHDACNFYFSFCAIFCPLTPLTLRKMKMSKKMKKLPGDIIILHKCTKNHDHMLHYSWDMVHGTYNCYFSFWAIFCPFTSATA